MQTIGEMRADALAAAEASAPTRKPKLEAFHFNASFDLLFGESGMGGLGRGREGVRSSSRADLGVSLFSPAAIDISSQRRNVYSFFRVANERT
jgi:hypothetical protein